MQTIEQLYHWFYLDRESANSQMSDFQTPLWIAPLKKANNYENLNIDYEHFAFGEKNEYFHGLKNFLWIEKSSFPPMFIFDNHNHAITFRYNTIYNKNIKDAKLIHIDQHSDNRENKYHLDLYWQENELENVFNFCNQKCNVWNFIQPAIKSWIISNQVQIRSTTALQNLQINKNQNYILDIDLDFCLNWIEKNKANYENIKILKKVLDNFWKDALSITIATSPYFLDQELATQIINNYLLNN